MAVLEAATTTPQSEFSDSASQEGECGMSAELHNMSVPPRTVLTVAREPLRGRAIASTCRSTVTETRFRGAIAGDFTAADVAWTGSAARSNSSSARPAQADRGRAA